MTNTKRPTWDEYFMMQAVLISSRSTCPRLNVGAVITKNNQIISTGYNGSVNKEDHCDEVGCLIEDNHCIRTVHAEMNAIIQCAKLNATTENATIYVTHFPCLNCTKAIIQAGIKTIKYREKYKVSEYVEYLLKKCNIQCEQVILNDKNLDALMQNL